MDYPARSRQNLITRPCSRQRGVCSRGSWWKLGEYSGYDGNDLDLGRITCAFCDEKGNFSLVCHREKRQASGYKQLNFDTLECGNCKGYVLVFWSGGSGLHDFRVLPYPLKVDRYPDYFPQQLGRFWVQAQRNLIAENCDATVVMARSALQFALRDNGASGRTLFDEINDLAEEGVLPPIIKEWASNVRELGNDAAHPSPGGDGPTPEEARDIVRFLDFLLEYLYRLPHDVEEYRQRRTT